MITGIYSINQIIIIESSVIINHSKYMTHVKFHTSHRPALQSGNYEIEVKEQIIITNPPRGGNVGTTASPTELGSTTQRFAVTGERYSLKPADIEAVFPPEGSFGDYFNVFPHVVLNRSTLPWERVSKQSSPGARDSKPWLALLLFNRTTDAQDEKPEAKQVKWKRTISNQDYYLLTDEEAATPSAAGLPVIPYHFVDEVGNHADDLLQVIDVPKSLLSRILPQENEIDWLAHTREYTDAGEEKEVSVILGKRLPKSGSVSEIHLVSLEGFFDSASQATFNSAGSDKKIRLISLKNWSFSCATANATFTGRLHKLDQSTFRLPNHTAKPDNSDKALIDKINDRLKEGKLLLPHYLREGSVTTSWYRGPLLPVTVNAPVAPTVPAKASDYLLEFDSEFKVLDAGYATAWELGRQLMLENKALSTQLYRWRRNHIQTTKRQKQQKSHLPLPVVSVPSVNLPSEVKRWLTDLTKLRGVPFDHIVPDERLLPNESIRFFKLDPVWITHLLDGAFSIGRSSNHYHQNDQGNWAKLLNQVYPLRKTLVQGFLLRSSVVSSRFHFKVKAYNTKLGSGDAGGTPRNGNLFQQIRLERLSDDIMIGLFYYDPTTSGVASSTNNHHNPNLQTLDFYTKPEVLHFGLHLTSGNALSSLKKQLRDNSGILNPSKEVLMNPPGGSLLGNEADRTVKINDLAQAIKTTLGKSTFDAVNFAFQMIEGVEKVRFTLA